MRVQVEMKNGEIRKFPISGSPYAGDYLRVKYEGAFVVIYEQYTQTAIPAADVREVRQVSGGY